MAARMDCNARVVYSMRSRSSVVAMPFSVTMIGTSPTKARCGATHRRGLRGKLPPVHRSPRRRVVVLDGLTVGAGGDADASVGLHAHPVVVDGCLQEYLVAGSGVGGQEVLVAGLGLAILHRDTPSDGEFRVRRLEVVAGGVVNVDEDVGRAGVGVGSPSRSADIPWPFWAAYMAAMLGSLMVPTCAAPASSTGPIAST